MPAVFKSIRAAGSLELQWKGWVKSHMVHTHTCRKWEMQCGLVCIAPKLSAKSESQCICWPQPVASNSTEPWKTHTHTHTKPYNTLIQPGSSLIDWLAHSFIHSLILSLAKQMVSTFSKCEMLSQLFCCLTVAFFVTLNGPANYTDSKHQRPAIAKGKYPRTGGFHSMVECNLIFQPTDTNIRSLWTKSHLVEWFYPIAGMSNIIVY
jgi:hypothetical protein